jgi:Ca2+-binding EF-hand superfamily protein
MAHDPVELWEVFDRNSGGSITRAEMVESLDRLGMAVPWDKLVTIITRIDGDSDECMYMDEFMDLYDAVMHCGGGGDSGHPDEEEEANMREAFNMFDRNGDRFITVDELHVVLTSLGMKQGREQDD